ncbi:MAG: hypothetical protein DRO15_07010 [Thermoprotei archaeon]|nr:MAG: hypothetical protein DRO15_07010 [Thermoprotei archaeon]
MLLVILFILRAVGLEEIERHIEVLESLIADGAEELQEELEKYYTLIRLREEEGELEFVEEIELAYDESLYSRLFSKAIVNILRVISNEQVNSISELARILKRDTANVYRDLKWLEDLGIVTLKRSGRRLVIKTNVLEYGLRFY